MIKLGANILSQTVQRNLARSTSDLSRSSERLASGQRINRASDDAAGLAISMSLDKDRILTQTARRNVSDGISMVSIMSSGLRSQKGILFRMAELAEQSANGTYSSQQREVLQQEYSSLMDEFDRIGDSTEFNGIKLLRNRDGQTIQMMAGISGADTSLLQVAAVNSHRYAGVVGQRSNVLLGGSNDFIGIPVPEGIETNNITASDINLITELTRKYPSDFENDPGELQPPLTFTSYNSPYMQDVSVSEFIDSRGRKGKLLFLISRVHGDLQSNFISPINVQPNAASQRLFYGAISSDGEKSVAASVVLPTVGGQPTDKSVNVNLTFSTSGASASIFIDLSSSRYESFDLLGPNARPSSVGFTNILTSHSAKRAVVVNSNRIDDLSQIEGQLGAVESRLQVAHSLLSTSGENFAAASSRIKDADFAAESANTVRSQILQQTAASLLGQANQAPQLALRLLQG